MMEAAIQTIPGDDKVVYEGGGPGGRAQASKTGRGQSDKDWSRHRRILDQGLSLLSLSLSLSPSLPLLHT